VPGVAIAERLAQLTLFADLTWPEIETITHLFDEQVFAPDQRVLRRGLGGSAFYIVMEGSAVVEVDGSERRTLGQGDFFGEISALTGEAPNADIVATRLLRCLVVPAPELEQFLLEHPHVLLRMLRTEVRRLRAAELVNE
jgi:CRP-like cAMP-binding protein